MGYAAGGAIANIMAKAASKVLDLSTAGVRAAAGMEQTNVAFETLLGSATKAQQVLAGIQRLGAETPLEFPELADAGRKLIAFGTAAKDVVPTLRRIGDVSSGIGAPIGEIADIYGKAQVQGRLFAEDINQLTGRGVPLIGELAKQFGVTQDKVRGLVESGSVSFPNLEKAFVSLTSKGGAFFGMMAKQGQTGAGLWSTLMDNLGQANRDLGKPILEAMKPLLAGAISLSPILADAGGQFGKKIVEAMDLLAGGIAYPKAALWTIGQGFMQSMATAGNYLAAGMKYGGGVLTAYFNVLPGILGPLTQGFGHALAAGAFSGGAVLMKGVERAIAALAAGLQYAKEHGVVELAKGLLNSAWNFGKAMVDAIRGQVATAWNYLSQLDQSRATLMGDLFNAALKHTGLDLSDRLTAGATDAALKAGKAFTAALDAAAKVSMPKFKLVDVYGAAGYKANRQAGVAALTNAGANKIASLAPPAAGAAAAAYNPFGLPDWRMAEANRVNGTRFTGLAPLLGASGTTGGLQTGGLNTGGLSSGAGATNLWNMQHRNMALRSTGKGNGQATEGTLQELKKTMEELRDTWKR